MRAIRVLFTLIFVTVLCPWSAVAVDGVNEINQTSITAAGGFPYTIPAAGSYVLTSDLTVPPGVNGLVAGADNIEIDLNGFTIIQAPGPGAAIGIDSAGFSGLVVRRGVIQGFSGPAISAGSSSKVIETKLTLNGAGVVGGVDCLIVMNNVVSNTNPGGPGTGVAAQHCKIENNVIASNAAAGISGGANVIVHNTIRDNLTGGILDFGASTIQQNMINGNTSFGISDGAPPGAPVLVPPPAAPARTDIIANTISDTIAGPPVGGRGISFTTPALVRDNTVSGNASDGVYCGAGSVVSGNTVNSNGAGVPGTGGVTVAAGSTVSGNSISYNAGFGLTLPAPATASYTNNTITGNAPGPNVVSPPTITGGFGNVCAPVACP